MELLFRETASEILIKRWVGGDWERQWERKILIIEIIAGKFRCPAEIRHTVLKIFSFPALFSE